MKILAMTAVVMMVGPESGAGEGARVERTVTVCMHQVDGAVTMARVLTSRMLQEIGVRIQWRCADRSRSGTSGIIAVSMSSSKSQSTGPFAYSFPFEGTRVVVYYDRVREAVSQQRVRVPRLLAYVLVHEITHMMQGLARHSISGIMKAEWNEDDYYAIQRDTLAFTGEDVDLIHEGLERRSTRFVATSGPLVR